MEKCFDALYHSIKKLRGEEHNASLELLVLLGEFETKKYYRDAGYSSLFNFGASPEFVGEVRCKFERSLQSR